MLHNEITNINAIGLSFTVLMGILLIFLPRRFAPIPILMTACFITLEQRINIVTLNFYALRILILFGWVRLIFQKEFFAIKLNSIDKALILWVISNLVLYTLLRQSFGAFINRLGFAFNCFGLYFLFRFLIRDISDIDRVFKFFAIIAIFFAGTILFEYITEKNLFSIFGGVQKEFETTQIRHGQLRCMGPFATPILTGTFGALLVPLSVILWFKGRNNRSIAVAVFIGGTFIVIASGSSGPLITYITAIVGLLMWRFRMYMKAIRWGTLFALIALYLFMKAPIWFLIGRISGYVGGGTGYHRSVVIDQAIKHFDEWWLLGTDYTVHWTGRAIEANPNMADITNWYIRQGVDGGLLTMFLFIIIIALCFRSIGKSLRIMESQPLAVRMTLWSMGTMLFAHVVTFMGVTYFDQMIVFWYLLLALISTIDSVSLTMQDQAGNKTLGLQNT